jgi:hypothetical protein
VPVPPDFADEYGLGDGPDAGAHYLSTLDGRCGPREYRVHHERPPIRNVSVVTRADPRIVAAIDAASPERQRRIAIVVAERALAAVPHHPPELDEALRTLHAGHLDADTMAAVGRVTDRLDERYFDLFDDEKPGGRTEGWETAFRAARAAAALGFAFDPDPRLAAAEAAYEAQFALDRDGELFALIAGTP